MSWDVGLVVDESSELRGRCAFDGLVAHDVRRLIRIAPVLLPRVEDEEEDEQRNQEWRPPQRIQQPFVVFRSGRELMCPGGQPAATVIPSW